MEIETRTHTQKGLSRTLLHVYFSTKGKDNEDETSVMQDLKSFNAKYVQLQPTSDWLFIIYDETCSTIIKKLRSSKNETVEGIKPFQMNHMKINVYGIDDVEKSQQTKFQQKTHLKSRPWRANIGVYLVHIVT